MQPRTERRRNENAAGQAQRCQVCGQPIYRVVSTLVDGQPLANLMAMTFGRHLTCATETQVMHRHDRRLADLRHAFPAPRHNWRTCECDNCAEERYYGDWGSGDWGMGE
jgi:hypothetical protein